jgi:hypothetical protein
MFLRSAIAVVLVALLAYGFMEAQPLIRGPALTLTSPVSGQTVPGGILTISWTAKRVVAVTFDGAPILPDEQGDFSEVITLPRGGAILSFTATDRFGRTITKQESVFVP